MSQTPDLTDRIVRLEELFTHQQHLLQQLNQELIKLRCEHEIHRERTRERVEQLEISIETEWQPPPNEKPPHY